MTKILLQEKISPDLISDEINYYYIFSVILSIFNNLNEIHTIISFNQFLITIKTLANNLIAIIFNILKIQTNLNPLVLKMLAVLKMKILTDINWTNTIINLNNYLKHFAIHTHFNHPNEITHFTEKIMEIFMKNKNLVRNQSVFLKILITMLKLCII